MREILQKIVDSTNGAKGALLMGFDGIVVEQYLAQDSQDLDIESMAMEFSFRFIELREAAETLELGGLNDISVKADNGCFLAHVITDEYFLGMLLGDAGHFGKGRWMLRSSAPSFAAEL